MEWFDRYEYEQDKKRYLRKVLNKVIDVFVVIIVILGFFAWKFSNYIDWEIFKDISIIKYIIYALICIGIVIFALIKGISELLPWIKGNKKKALKILLWIVLSFMLLLAFCALLAKLILSTNDTSSV